jgi:hypothetical protein
VGLSMRTAGRSLAALVLAFGLSGCSDGESSDKPEPNGIEDLKAAAAIKESARASRGLADVTYEGKGGFRFETGLTRVHVKALVTKKGACEMVMTSKQTGRMTVRLVGGTSYLRGDFKTWTAGFGAPEVDARLLSGKWFSAPVTADSAEDCSIREFSAQTADPASCTKGKAGEVDGTPTLAFRCDDEDSGDAATLHVATVDDPLVLRIVGRDKDGPFDMRLVDRDTGVSIKAPPEKQVIDGSQLG